MAKRELKQCRECKEKILKEAKKCKYCGEWASPISRLKHALIIPILISLFAGALLFSWGQNEESERQKRIKVAETKKKNNKIIVLLKKEFSENDARLNNIENLLKADLDYLKRGKITITPLGNFFFDAWEKAKFSDASFLLDASTKDFMKLANCYFILNIIGRKVEDRESYRIFNENRNNFVERMESLDKNILDNIEKIRPIFKQAQDYLYDIHDWKVKGGSFDIDNGLVVEIDAEKKENDSTLENSTRKSRE